MNNEKNSLEPYDGVPTVGERVWWEDPDSGECSGWWYVASVHQDEDSVLLAAEDGGPSVNEAYFHELWTPKER